MSTDRTSVSLVWLGGLLDLLRLLECSNCGLYQESGTTQPW